MFFDNSMNGIYFKRNLQIVEHIRILLILPTYSNLRNFYIKCKEKYKTMTVKQALG